MNEVVKVILSSTVIGTIFTAVSSLFINSKMERVKGKILNEVNYNKTLTDGRWALKKEVYIDALDLIDVIVTNREFSTLAMSVQKKVGINNSEELTSEARKVLNRMIAVSDNKEIIELYIKIALLKKVTDNEVIDNIDMFRKIVRKEMGFNYIDIPKEYFLKLFTLEDLKKLNSGGK